MILDIGCGNNKVENATGMDFQPGPAVDVVHNWNVYPWPFDDSSFQQAVASHVVEHVNPADFGFINWMNEVWRILKPGGVLTIVTPYAGTLRYWHDPTHCNGCTEATFAYFDPELHEGYLYRNYKPLPWQLVSVNKMLIGDLYVQMAKRVTNGTA